MAASSSDIVGEVQGTCSVDAYHSLEETWRIAKFMQRIESGVSVLKSPVFSSSSLPLVRWQIRFDMKDAKETSGLNLLVVLKDNGDLPTPISGDLTVQLVVPASHASSSNPQSSSSTVSVWNSHSTIQADCGASSYRPNASPSAAKLSDTERRRLRRVQLSLPSINTAQAFWEYLPIKDLPELVDRNDDGALRIKVHIGVKARVDETKLTEFQRPSIALLEPSGTFGGSGVGTALASCRLASPGASDPESGKYLGSLINPCSNAPLFADVEIVVGGEVIVRAHRLILALNSPVFRTMLEGGRFAEGRSQRVAIGDAAPEAVRALVRYLYAGAIEDRILARDDAAIVLLELADRYQVASLRRRCVSWLMSHLSVQNVLSALSRADLHSQCDELKRACIAFVARNAMSIINASENTGWQEFVVKHPGLVTELFAALSTQAATTSPNSSSNSGTSSSTGACSCAGKRRRTEH